MNCPNVGQNASTMLWVCFFSFMAPVAQSNLVAASTHCSIRPWHVWRASSCCALRRLAPRWVTSCWPLSMGKPPTPGSRWTTQSAGWSVADTELTAQPYPILSGWHIQCSRLLCTALEYEIFRFITYSWLIWWISSSGVSGGECCLLWICVRPIPIWEKKTEEVHRTHDIHSVEGQTTKGHVFYISIHKWYW